MNLFDLTGKTALVTGASGGLGAQMARALSCAGARVVLAARRIEKLKALADELNDAVAMEMDVSSKASVADAFQKLEQGGENIDICVNNAAIAKATSLFEADEDGDFERILQTNVMGVWYVTKAVANHMKNHGIHGSIINIASIAGNSSPSTARAGYSVSKAAVLHLAKGLVGDLSPHNIRINAISPGYFPTDMSKRLREKLGDEGLRKMIPLSFLPDHSDIDGAVLYLASNKASRYVTGSVITVDGGISWSGLG